MIRFTLGLLILSLAASGCKKDDDNEEFTGPVWILNVSVRDGSRTDGLLQSCAHVIWSYAGTSDQRDTACRHTNGNVKVWEGISEDVRIFYHVESEGYGQSTEEFADFQYSQLDSTTESGNPEVVVNRTVYLYPN
ncbi:hypothetical protein KJZ99_10980 [bacterium]|nr:hypothetical protein [bacterium]